MKTIKTALIVMIMAIIGMVSCKKEDAPIQAKKDNTVYYDNKTTLIYVSNWNDSTIFYYSNFSDPHDASGSTSNPCLLAHMLNIGDKETDIYGAAQYSPNGNLHTKNWTSFGNYVMRDTITLEWQATNKNAKLFFFSDIVHYSPCSGFQKSLNPWMAGSLYLTPDSTYTYPNYRFNYTFIQ